MSSAAGASVPPSASVTKTRTPVCRIVAPGAKHAVTPSRSWAFQAALNAHDLEGVAAFFAPGATIRQTGVRVVVTAADGGTDVPAAEDTYGAGPRSLGTAQDAGDWPRGDVLWAAGAPRIRAWVSPFFAAGHRVQASAYRAEGATVTWMYRASADPYQGLAGVEPAAGTAAPVVRAERRRTIEAWLSEEPPPHTGRPNRP